MKLALHRSITFWSGLLVMGFICWGWWLSGVIMHAAGGTPLYVGNIGSGIFISHDDGPSTGWRFVNHTIGGGMPLRCIGPYFVRQTREMEEAVSLGWRNEILGSGRPGNWSVFLPHWILLLAVALPWSGLLVWRARRRKRRMTDGGRWRHHESDESNE